MSSLGAGTNRDEQIAAQPQENEARALMVEALFGERIPKCRNCGALDSMWNDYARAAMRCRECHWLEASEQVLMVPKDERLR